MVLSIKKYNNDTFCRHIDISLFAASLPKPSLNTSVSTLDIIIVDLTCMIITRAHTLLFRSELFMLHESLYESYIRVSAEIEVRIVRISRDLSRWVINPRRYRCLLLLSTFFPRLIYLFFFLPFFLHVPFSPLFFHLFFLLWCVVRGRRIPFQVSWSSISILLRTRLDPPLCCLLSRCLAFWRFNILPSPIFFSLIVFDQSMSLN